jgi:hypothetical protein
VAVTADLLSSWRVAQLAELAWLGQDGAPRLAVVVPLVDDGRPALALTYDRLTDAESIAAARRIVLAVTTPLLANGATPVVAEAQLALTPDPRGVGFEDRLLAQELAKHPPSRQWADSRLLRREHWWYLPRLLLHASRLAPSRPLAAGDALAAVATGGRLAVAAVGLDDASSERPRTTTPLPDGQAVLLRHGADVPDLDRRWERRWRGRVVDGELVVEATDALPRHRGRSGVWRRWREEAAYERACREGLRTVGAA